MLPASEQTAGRHKTRPVWPWIIVAGMLFAAVGVLWLWRDTVLERRAIQRLNSLPGVTVTPNGIAAPNPRIPKLPFGLHRLLFPPAPHVFAIRFEQRCPREFRDSLRHIRHVNYLSANGAWFTDDDLAAISLGEYFRIVELIDTAVTDAGLSRLEACQRLSVVRLSGSSIKGPELARLARLPHLRQLNLSRTLIDDASLARFAGKRALGELDLYLTPVTDRCATTLASFPNLHKLSLDRTSIGDATLRVLGKKHHYWELLSLRYTRVSSDGLTASGLKANRLFLAGTNIGDEFAPRLAEYHSIQRLDLSNTRFSDEGLRQLRAMRGLIALKIQNCPITDRGVVALLHAQPDIAAKLSTPAEFASALARPFLGKSPRPYVWLSGDDVRGTKVSSLVSDILNEGPNRGDPSSPDGPKQEPRVPVRYHRR